MTKTIVNHRLIGVLRVEGKECIKIYVSDTGCVRVSILNLDGPSVIRRYRTFSQLQENVFRSIEKSHLEWLKALELNYNNMTKQGI